MNEINEGSSNSKVKKGRGRRRKRQEQEEAIKIPTIEELERQLNNYLAIAENNLEHTRTMLDLNVKVLISRYIAEESYRLVNVTNQLLDSLKQISKVK